MIDYFQQRVKTDTQRGRLTCGCSLLACIVRERILCFGHADRIAGKALLCVGLDLLLRLFGVRDAIGMVDLSRDALNLLLDGQFVPVQDLEVIWLLADFDDGVCELDRAFTALCPVVGWDSCVRASFKRDLTDEFELRIRVIAVRRWSDPGLDVGVVLRLREPVDSNNHLDTKLLGILYVSDQVRATLLEDFEILFEVDLGKRLSWSHLRAASVHLESSDRRNDDDSVWLQATNSTLYVAELFHAERATLASRSNARL